MLDRWLRYREVTSGQLRRCSTGTDHEQYAIKLVVLIAWGFECMLCGSIKCSVQLDTYMVPRSKGGL